MPIGIFITDNQSFTNQEIELETDDCIYMFSDGYIDQSGGNKGKKFYSKSFKELLIKISDKAMSQQKKNSLKKLILIG